MTSEIVETIVQEALQMLKEGVARYKILAHLVHAAELASGDDSVSSILVLDNDGLLRNGASPGLPYDYLRAIDGLKPNARVGTCAAAAATGSMVITADFLQDDKWAELRHLPLSIGFVSAWSIPIKNYNGEVLGTFGTYFREKRQPSQAEIDTINALALAAARVIDHSR